MPNPAPQDNPSAPAPAEAAPANSKAAEVAAAEATAEDGSVGEIVGADEVAVAAATSIILGV